jgi:phosphoribosylglycinamide formyltransferase-1
MESKFRIAIFASGSGTNAEAIINYFRDHNSIEVVLLLSNNPQAYALERAKKFGIKSGVFNRAQFRESNDVLNKLGDHAITHIVLAGFLWLVPENLVAAFPSRIVNIHPALLPKYGGKGMFGSHVHEAIRAANETETGITIHVVDEHYDEGDILFQAKCEVASSDTPDSIAQKVHQLEHTHYPKEIERWILRK